LANPPVASASCGGAGGGMAGCEITSKSNLGEANFSCGIGGSFGLEGHLS
jgi:hypothetical protein